MNNKFCPSCGQRITEEGLFCINCGYKFENNNHSQAVVADNVTPNNYNNNVNVNAVQQQEASNGMATAGFVLGIVSLCCCCYTSFLGIVGLVFSIMGLNNSKNLPGNKGKGLAIAGIVLNSISVSIGLFSFIFGMIGAFVS